MTEHSTPPSTLHPPPTMGGRKWVAYGCLALSMSLVGVYVAMSKPLTAAMPVFLLAWLRFGIAAVAMAHWLRPAPNEPPLDASTKRLVFLESFFGNFLFSICMLYGVRLSSAVSAGVILSMIPAAVAILSWLLLKERVGARVWLAAALGVLGIALLSLAQQKGTVPTAATHDTGILSSEALLGSALVFGAVLCEAVYAVLGKKLTKTLSPKRISALINLCGFFLMTPLGLYGAWGFDFSSVPVHVWVLLVFYALAASMWTVWLWMTGLQTIAASKAGVFTVMLPITAAVVGVLVLRETLGHLELIAFAIALAGVILATLPPFQRGQAPNAPR